jgi:hypothetical protein
MNDFDPMQPKDAFFSKRIRAGKRTYYFDVKATRGNDYYITITESKRKPGESEDRPFFEKHKLFLYKEDFDKFAEGLQESLDYIREKRSSEEGLEHSSEMSRSDQRLEAEPVSTNFNNIEFDDLAK